MSLIFFTIAIISIVALDDPLSKWLRGEAELAINAYVEHLTDKAFENELSLIDKTILNGSILAGITFCRFACPEASNLLYHYVYGDGSDLGLRSDYFQKSPYLIEKIKALGMGQHGPIALKQSQDWRLSLALNPYYLNITAESIRLFHPNIEFAPLSDVSGRVVTIVPIGKMRLKIYDNLISAMNPQSFYVYAEWPNSMSL